LLLFDCLGWAEDCLQRPIDLDIDGKVVQLHLLVVPCGYSGRSNRDIDEVIGKLKSSIKGGRKLPVLLPMSKSRALREIAAAGRTEKRPIKWVSEENQMLHAARHKDASPFFIGRAQEMFAVHVNDDLHSDYFVAAHNQMMTRNLQIQRSQIYIRRPTFELGLPNWIWERRLRRTLEPENIKTWRKGALEQIQRTSDRASELERLLCLQSEIEGDDDVDSESVTSYAKLLSESCMSPAEAQLLVAGTVTFEKPRIAIKVRPWQWFGSLLVAASVWLAGSKLGNLLFGAGRWKVFLATIIPWNWDRSFNPISWEYPVEFSKGEEEARLQHAVNMAVFAASACDANTMLVVASQSDVDGLRDGITRAAANENKISWQEILNTALCDTDRIACDDDGYFTANTFADQTPPDGVVPSRWSVEEDEDIDWTVKLGNQTWVSNRKRMQARPLTVIDPHSDYGTTTNCSHVSDMLLNAFGQFTAGELRKRKFSHQRGFRAAQVTSTSFSLPKQGRFVMPSRLLPHAPPERLQTSANFYGSSVRQLSENTDQAIRTLTKESLTKNYGNRNKRCPCGSGKKFKRCCGTIWYKK
jgi:hypothetical protein